MYRRKKEIVKGARIVFAIVSLQEILEQYNLKIFGSMIYVDTSFQPNPTPSNDLMFYKRELNNLIISKFGKLLRTQSNSKGLFADVLELLYSVRNYCVHGHISDPLTHENNELFQSAYECILIILQEFTELPTSTLHY